MQINELFSGEIKVVNMGLTAFNDAIAKQGLKGCQVDWKPPADPQVYALLDALDDEKVDAANREAVRRINAAEPVWYDVVRAGDVIPELNGNVIGHAGPDLAWEEMCGPLKGAILGAAVYEGMAEDLDAAERMAQRGEIRFLSNHAIGCVGPMTGMITKSMPLVAVRNDAYGNTAYSTFNEGLGKVMRFGANGPEVLERLRWMEKVLGPALKQVLALSGPIALKTMIAKALTMGDEMHQRNIAASALMVRTVLPYLVQLDLPAQQRERITAFLCGNDQLFLNFAMAAGKATMDPVKNIPHCSVVTAMSRNGTNFGIKVSALGETWFEAPVMQPQGLYFPGYTEKDANPDIGDSAICESFGIGGVAMGSAPAVVRFVGAASVEQAYQYSRDMLAVTAGQSTTYLMPSMNFIGTGTGFDIRKVTETGILPVINTGMAHKKPGIGQVGAGIVRAPMGCFRKALEAFATSERNAT